MDIQTLAVILAIVLIIVSYNHITMCSYYKKEIINLTVEGDKEKTKLLSKIQDLNIKYDDIYGQMYAVEQGCNRIHYHCDQTKPFVQFLAKYLTHLPHDITHIAIVQRGHHIHGIHYEINFKIGSTYGYHLSVDEYVTLRSNKPEKVFQLMLLDAYSKMRRDVFKHCLSNLNEKL